MAKRIQGKYGRWLRRDGLTSITNWVARGCTLAELAHNMGISRKTLWDWTAKYPEIAQAIQDGRDLSVQAIENSLFKQAMGEVYEEQEVTEERIVDGEVVTLHKTVRTKKQPNAAATIFFLKNRAGYRDNPTAPAEDDRAPVDPLSRALIERAGRLDNGSKR